MKLFFESKLTKEELDQSVNSILGRRVALHNLLIMGIIYNSQITQSSRIPFNIQNNVQPILSSKELTTRRINNFSLYNPIKRRKMFINSDSSNRSTQSLQALNNENPTLSMLSNRKSFSSSLGSSFNHSSQLLNTSSLQNLETNENFSNFINLEALYQRAQKFSQEEGLELSKNALASLATLIENYLLQSINLLKLDASSSPPQPPSSFFNNFSSRNESRNDSNFFLNCDSKKVSEEIPSHSYHPKTQSKEEMAKRDPKKMLSFLLEDFEKKEKGEPKKKNNLEILKNIQQNPFLMINSPLMREKLILN